VKGDALRIGTPRRRSIAADSRLALPRRDMARVRMRVRAALER
jgi:hypothetical protein